MSATVFKDPPDTWPVCPVVWEGGGREVYPIPPSQRGSTLVRIFELSHTGVCKTQNRSEDMGNVKSIEKAVESLPPSELAEFRHWFAEFDAAAWDKQIEQDANSGKLDFLASEALSDYRSGSAREF